VAAQIVVFAGFNDLWRLRVWSRDCGSGRGDASGQEGAGRERRERGAPGPPVLVSEQENAPYVDAMDTKTPTGALRAVAGWALIVDNTFTGLR
jgi:hypothetical protein